jgi:hypothetical protein
MSWKAVAVTLDAADVIMTLKYQNDSLAPRSRYGTGSVLLVGLFGCAMCLVGAFDVKCLRWPARLYSYTIMNTNEDLNCLETYNGRYKACIGKNHSQMGRYKKPESKNFARRDVILRPLHTSFSAFLQEERIMLHKARIGVPCSG